MTHTGISSRYAKALVDALSSSPAVADPHVSLRALQEFVDLMGQSRDLELVMYSPSVLPRRKRAVIEKIAGRMQFDRMIQNFLFVLIDHRRLPLLREISDMSFVILDERLGFLRARISAAAPLSQDEENQIAEKLGRITGKRIRVEFNVEPELIGGVVARVGSTVYDGSVLGRLRSIGERLNAE